MADSWLNAVGRSSFRRLLDCNSYTQHITKTLPQTILANTLTITCIIPSIVVDLYCDSMVCYRQMCKFQFFRQYDPLMKFPNNIKQLKNEVGLRRENIDLFELGHLKYDIKY